jgi:hypothetical protein
MRVMPIIFIPNSVNYRISLRARKKYGEEGKLSLKGVLKVS